MVSGPLQKLDLTGKINNGLRTRYFDEHPLRGGKLDKFRSLTEQSLAHQQQTERSDVVDFESFLKSYLAFE